MPTALSDRERFHPETRAAWRDWLAAERELTIRAPLADATEYAG